MWPHYIYIHRKASDGEPFYIGKGKLRRKMMDYERANAKNRRSKFWDRVYKKHGMIVEIVAHCVNDTEAQRVEKILIKEIGRRDIGTGPLVNLTDGGEGHAGIIVSDELRKIRSINSKRPHTPEAIAKIRAARKNGGNGGVVKHGDKLPPEWVASLSRSKMGEKNPFYGKLTPIAKKVRNVHTGVIYDSIKIASEAEGISLSALYQYLDGHRLNRSPLVRV